MLPESSSACDRVDVGHIVVLGCLGALLILAF